MVCKPKDEDGLGIINLKTQNKAHLVQHLHKFFNKEDIPWVQLVLGKHYRNGMLPGNTQKKVPFVGEIFSGRWIHIKGFLQLTFRMVGFAIFGRIFG